MKNKNAFRAAALLACAALIASLPDGPGAAAAEDDARVTASVGLDYTTGDYGQSADTDMLALAFAARYETGRWTYRASVPYIRVSGPSNVVASDEGGVALGEDGGQPGRRHRSGRLLQLLRPA